MLQDLGQGWSSVRQTTAWLGMALAFAGCDQGSRSTTSEPGPIGSSSPWPPALGQEIVAIKTLSVKAATSPYCQLDAAPIALVKDVLAQVDTAIVRGSALSDDQEIKLSQQIESELPKTPEYKGRLSPKGEQKTERYLNQIVGHLARFSKRPKLPWRVRLIRQSSFNAFALPGGLILVHTGMLQGQDAVRSEAELVAVLAHEVAHIDLRHPMAALQMVRLGKKLAGDELADGLPDEAVLLAIAHLVRTPFLSTAQERAADRSGLKLMVNAGYNPMAAANLWSRFVGQAKRPDNPLAQLMELADEMVGSHPPTRSRVCTALEAAEAVHASKRTEPLYEGKINLERRVPGFEKAY